MKLNQIKSNVRCQVESLLQRGRLLSLCHFLWNINELNKYYFLTATLILLRICLGSVCIPQVFVFSSISYQLSTRLLFPCLFINSGVRVWRPGASSELWNPPPSAASSPSTWWWRWWPGSAVCSASACCLAAPQSSHSKIKKSFQWRLY